MRMSVNVDPSRVRKVPSFRGPRRDACLVWPVATGGKGLAITLHH
jgi:hypothetical protein